MDAHTYGRNKHTLTVMCEKKMLCAIIRMIFAKQDVDVDCVGNLSDFSIKIQEINVQKIEL